VRHRRPAPRRDGLRGGLYASLDEIAARLRRVGASWDDVVEISSFHTDLVSQMPAIVAVKRRYVHSPYPAWTAVGVTRLIPGSGITEIRVIARRPAAQSR
jgi:enamine deaminase RidA (YjgF/YER057c/UK114 family)